MMKKTVGNLQNTNKKSKGLFAKSGTDELYKILQGETLEWHKAAKSYWQEKYDIHCHLLDKNFATELPKDTFGRLWELTQVDYLSSHSHKRLRLIQMVGKDISKPDFCFEVNGKRFYHETVCTSPGIRPELLVELATVSGKARRTPIPEYMESICSALREKAEMKYYGKINNGYKAYMDSGSGLIIALSTSKIPFHNQANNFNIDLSCIFGMSPLKIPLIPGQDYSYHMGDPYHDFQSTFNKTTNKHPSNKPTPIKMDYFANDQFSHISAIILSHTGLVFFPSIDQFVDYCRWENCRNDYVLVHNPFASTPLPHGIIDVAREVTATITTTGIDIHVKNFK